MRFADKRKLKDNAIQRHSKEAGASNQQAGVAFREVNERAEDKRELGLRHPYERAARSRCVLLELTRGATEAKSEKAVKHDCRIKSTDEKLRV